MTAFAEAVLVDRLVKLNPSQQSIQSMMIVFNLTYTYPILIGLIVLLVALSHWIMYHRKQYEKIVAIWLAQFRIGIL